MTQKPTLEKVSPAPGSSFTVKHFPEGSLNLYPHWHFHPEIELVYINGGSGKRHIGNHLGYFNQGDLLMIGSNLPHYGFTDRLTGNVSETVIQFRPDFLGETFLEKPEMEPIRSLFERALQGIRFGEAARKELGPRLEELAKKNGLDRLVGLIGILKDMAASEDYTLLNAEKMTLETNQQDNDRIDKVYAYVREHFRDSISLDQISTEVNMTVPGFCRFFKKQTNNTFTRFVNEFRVVHACKLLSETRLPITEVCFESGFNNFSNFSKLFREFTGRTPSEYRKEKKRIVQ